MFWSFETFLFHRSMFIDLIVSLWWHIASTREFNKSCVLPTTANLGQKIATSIINLSFSVASAAVHSKAVLLLLLIQYLLLLPLFAWVLCWVIVLFCRICLLSSLQSPRWWREMIALLCLYSWRRVASVPYKLTCGTSLKGTGDAALC